MFHKIQGNLNFDLLLEILLVFYQNLLLNYYKTMINNSYRAILLKKTFFTLITNILSVINLPFLFFSFFFYVGLNVKLSRGGEAVLEDSKQSLI